MLPFSQGCLLLLLFTTVHSLSNSQRTVLSRTNCCAHP